MEHCCGGGQKKSCAWSALAGLRGQQGHALPIYLVGKLILFNGSAPFRYYMLLIGSSEYDGVDKK